MGIDGVTNIMVIGSRETFFWNLPLMLTSPHLSPGPRKVSPTHLQHLQETFIFRGLAARISIMT